MKKFLLITALVVTQLTHAQLYYGFGGGASFNTCSSDILLHSVVGFAFVNSNGTSGLLAEGNLHASLTGTIAPSFSAGVKADFSTSAGIHLLAGITDDFDYTVKPIAVKHNWYASGTARLWVNKVMVQTTYFNKTWYCTIGIIGFGRTD